MRRERARVRVGIDWRKAVAMVAWALLALSTSGAAVRLRTLMTGTA
jgi:hypothetical protein